jgi:peroxiredoxin
MAPTDQPQTLDPPPRPPPEPGDPAPFIATVDQDGTPFHSNADGLAGHPLLLLFCPTTAGALAEALLSAGRERWPALAAAGAALFAVSRLPAEINRAARAAWRLPFAILSDDTGQLFRAYGTAADGGEALAVLLDPAHRIAWLKRAPAGAELVEAALAELGRAFPPAAGRLAGHAPVLVLPRVLSPDDCRLLIEHWRRPAKALDSGAGFTAEGAAAERGDFRVEHDGDYARMTEYILRDPAACGWLDRRFRRRVAPEIAKAFQTAVGQREDWRIVRYGVGGVVRPHRDNVMARSHRRFTMTINLNAGEYEGGALRFGEYGGQLYEVERGTAVVWSAALLHEVTPVTAGQRFVVGAHLFG